MYTCVCTRVMCAISISIKKKVIIIKRKKKQDEAMDFFIMLISNVNIRYY